MWEREFKKGEEWEVGSVRVVVAGVGGWADKDDGTGWSKDKGGVGWEGHEGSGGEVEWKMVVMITETGG